MAKITFLLKSDKPTFHLIPKHVRFAFALLGALYACLCLTLFAQQRSLLFHPMKAPLSLPNGTRMIEKGELRFWHTSAAEGPDLACHNSAIAYFGGNAEPSSQIGSKAPFVPGCKIYALAYPGYEGAHGTPSEVDIHLQADAMIQRMKDDGIDLSRSILVGRSLGSGEAVRQASLAQWGAAVLVTPYNSLSSVASEKFPGIPISILMRDPFETEPWAKEAKSNAIILFADNDSTIPEFHAHALSKTWNPKHTATVATNSKLSHENSMNLESTWQTIAQTAYAASKAIDGPKY